MEKKPRFYQFDDVRVDLEEFEVVKAGVRVRLEPKAFEALVFLIEHRGRLVEKKELLDAVWKEAFVTENAMTRVIAQLRKALGDDSKEAKYIETVPTRGYRFIAEVGQERSPGSDVIDGASQKANGEPESLAPLSSKKADLFTRRSFALGGFAVLVLAALTLYYFLISGGPKRSREQGQSRSIAVLPFKPIVAAERDQVYELGLANSLIFTFSSIKEISVRPIEAMRKYIDLDLDPVAAGREQGVDFVLSSHYQISGGQIRVTSQLINVNDGSTFETFKCDEKCTNIFETQDAISLKVGQQLLAKLTDEQRRRLTKRYTDNPEAYELYITGQYYLKKNSAESRMKAVEYFGRAIERDPNYALPHTGLAQAYVLLAGAALPPAEAMPKAEAAAIKALEIDGELAAAHVSLGMVKVYYQWDWSGAEREFKRAIDLNRDAADTHREYGLILAVAGRRDESISELERAQQLDPLSVSIIYGAGVAYLFAGQTDRSIELFRTTLEMDPNYVASHYHLSTAYVRKGMYQEAIKEAQTAIRLSRDNPLFYAQLGRVYALSGNRNEAVKVLGELKEMSRRRQVSPYYSAEIYASLGEKDQAFALLEEAYNERFRYLVFLKVGSWDSLRSDPRFTDLLRRVGLPQ
jgi:DNA-binding winged helix-turn-helix (wHTH) protein/tetratricopeptide (TPR) repeat protein